MHDQLYLGLDAHASTCVLAAVDESGQPLYPKELLTSEAAFVEHVRAYRARHKFLAVEASSLAGWIAGVLRPHVDELIVCDPRHNALISCGGNKDDVADAFKLSRLLRLGALTPVYHTDLQHQAEFKIAAQQYLSVRRDVARLKTQIKTKFRQAGMMRVSGAEVFAKTHRDQFLKQAPSEARRQIIGRLYEFFDAAHLVRQKAQGAMVEIGRRYP